MGLSANILRRAREDYDEERKGFKMSVGKTVLRGLRLGVTPNFEVIGIQNIDGNAPLIVKDQEGSSKKLSLELTAMLDRLDNRMSPSRGYKITSSLEFSGLDVDMIKFVSKRNKISYCFQLS